MRPVASFDQMGTSVGGGINGELMGTSLVGRECVCLRQTQSLTIEEDLKGSACEQLTFDGVGEEEGHHAGV